MKSKKENCANKETADVKISIKVCYHFECKF